MTNSESKPDNGDGEYFFDIEEYLSSLVRSSNAVPLEDFSGLSPDQMHHLLYYPLESERSPVYLQENLSGETFDAIPLFRLVEEFIKTVGREGFIKLTPKGALPRKILHELYGFGFLKEEFIEKGYVKLMRESDSVVLTTLPIVARLSGLITKKFGRFALTNRGRKSLEGNRREEMFRLVFETFTDKFNWDYNDRHPVSGVGQFGWAYTIFLLLKFGDSDRTIGFYADKYTTAFPTLWDRFQDGIWGTARDQCTSCYALRAFERFLKWFGFIQFKDDDDFLHREKSVVRRTDVLENVFALK
ncbi:MAG: hypothetical protein M1469_02560 [Bacteroidetes bacterium]|nr:hypothetical protein [Bacteroidota bacterium]